MKHKPPPLGGGCYDYFSTQEGSQVAPEQPVTGKAGTVAFANYDLWHRAMPNQTDKRRYMMKFLYAPDDGTAGTHMGK